MEARLPLGASQISYARVDAEYLAGKDSPLWKPAGEGSYGLPLPDGRVLNVRVESSEMLDSVRFASLGSIEGRSGSRVVLTGGAEGQFALEITETGYVAGPGAAPVIRHYVMEPSGAPEMLVYEVDQTQSPGCGADSFVRPAVSSSKASLARQALAAQAKASTRTAALVAGAQADGAASVLPTVAGATVAPLVQVDVLFLYTQAVEDAQFGLSAVMRRAAVLTRVDNIVASTNSDFLRSDIRLKIRAVATDLVQYDEYQASADVLNSTALTQLGTDGDGVLDGIHARRDAVGADLVCLMLNRDNSGGSIGIAPLLTAPSVGSKHLYLFNDDWAFSVVSYAYTSGYNLVAHEMGHNFGAHHDRENATGTNGQGQTVLEEGAFPYAYGYRFYGQNGVRYRTIMSYYPGTRISYFSNPNIIASEDGVNVAVGVAENGTNPCFNAKTLSLTAFEVSQYRHQVTDPVAAGTMVNVSTRAFVGKETDHQALIAGFAIEGTGQKEVLIRAVGPSLGQFGVPALLADPQIKLDQIATSSVLTTVDDWSTQPNATAITAAATALNAFALTSNKDSALLMQLSPGMYTATVTGVGNTTGTGLVEVYETASGGTAKLVNVSTRAYATTTNALVGGFVITGEAGKTKRVLVRAQGPNLANYGLTGVMSDPMIKLYRVSEGTKYIMACDDWTASKGQVDDDHPTATYYDEKAIAATGFAPKNRREPALLLDLEPGMYTVEVTPFFFVGATPETSQAEQPGVALVEVFEITQ